MIAYKVHRSITVNSALTNIQKKDKVQSIYQSVASYLKQILKSVENGEGGGREAREDGVGEGRANN